VHWYFKQTRIAQCSLCVGHNHIQISLTPLLTLLVPPLTREADDGPLPFSTAIPVPPEANRIRRILEVRWATASPEKCRGLSVDLAFVVSELDSVVGLLWTMTSGHGRYRKRWSMRSLPLWCLPVAPLVTARHTLPPKLRDDERLSLATTNAAPTSSTIRHMTSRRLPHDDLNVPCTCWNQLFPWIKFICVLFFRLHSSMI